MTTTPTGPGGTVTSDYLSEPDPANMPPPAVPPPLPSQPGGIGFAITRYMLDQRLGELAKGIEHWAPQAIELETWLEAMSDEALQAAPFMYAAADVSTLRKAVGDMATVARVYLGQATVTTQTDFGKASRPLSGLFRT